MVQLCHSSKYELVEYHLGSEPVLYSEACALFTFSVVKQIQGLVLRFPVGKETDHSLRSCDCKPEMQIPPATRRIRTDL